MMSLFDMTALTIEQVRANQSLNEGATIRKLSGGVKPVIRTIRHKPWNELLGKGPEDATCGGCIHLKRQGGKYFKCGQHPVTSGPGTDIRCKDQACKMFEPNVRVSEQEMEARR